MWTEDVSIFPESLSLVHTATIDKSLINASLTGIRPAGMNWQMGDVRSERFSRNEYNIVFVFMPYKSIN